MRTTSGKGPLPLAGRVTSASTLAAPSRVATLPVHNRKEWPSLVTVEHLSGGRAPSAGDGATAGIAVATMTALEIATAIRRTGRPPPSPRLRGARRTDAPPSRR